MSIKQLIINSPFEEPKKFWRHNPETRSFAEVDGRRPAGYVVASESSKSFDDPGKFVEIPLPNQIRPRVKAWRETGYPGVSGITKRLLEHWNDVEAREGKRFFFCQLEAIEALIWLTEAPESERVGIEIPSDGGLFPRVCSKLATGTGKTIVMAMVIAWQVLNKVTYPQDNRFSKHIFIVAPGLTVKNRLQVLIPSSVGNYYEEFNILPPGLQEIIHQGKVMVRNWHTLQWDSEEQLAKRRGVDKRGAKSDEAYVREVLEELASSSNLIVINDEAHHAWRIQNSGAIKGISKDELEQATKWIGGLDRIHRSRGILKCFDFSATPFVPSGKQSSEEALFGWIVSDFGLNDAIESGLVKTPRVVVRDDARVDTKSFKSRLYHIYSDAEVKDDIIRKAEPDEPLPDLIVNAYYLLGKDWQETAKEWEKSGRTTPPVMISVVNRTETAARIKFAFDKKRIKIDELCDPTRTLHIDSKVLREAEEQEETAVAPSAAVAEADDEGDDAPIERKLSKKEQAEQLRKTVDTVGQPGKPGEMIQNVISVGMLSEGWDAKTVTHIMGLRAFSSQLLCEQVVGRGLRRTTYDINDKTGLFDAEHVNIFGIPFTFMPHESQDGPPPPPPRPKSRIEPVKENREFEIRWPNILRIEHTYLPVLSLDMNSVATLEINAYDTAKLAEMAPVVDGKPDITKLSTIDLEELGRKQRMQRIIFETARDVYAQMNPGWKGNREFLLAQVIRLVEQFMNSPMLVITPPGYAQDDLKRRILLTLNMSKLFQHIWEAIHFENKESAMPVFDPARPIRSTADMQAWYTGKPCEFARKSHINLCVFDSGWEASEAFELERNPNVVAWAKNDHLGFEIYYLFMGIVHRYFPDFLIRLKNGTTLILETKGQDDQKNQTKRRFLDEWVQSVNNQGGFGKWAWAVSKNPADLPEILKLHS